MAYKNLAHTYTSMYHKNKQIVKNKKLMSLTDQNRSVMFL